ncbi:hypothetical protein K438DRAFT_1837872, partial [Mycena galopus ATCC 62051]
NSIFRESHRRLHHCCSKFRIGKLEGYPEGHAKLSQHLRNGNSSGTKTLSDQHQRPQTG